MLERLPGGDVDLVLAVVVVLNVDNGRSFVTRVDSLALREGDRGRGREREKETGA